MDDAAPLPASDESAPDPNRFVRARLARQGEIAEDYVELIAELIDRQGEARAADIARILGVTHVTVVKTIARLARDGLVTSRPYRAIFLTTSGRELAERTRARHEIVWRFLVALGIDPHIAQQDAEGMEHHVSQTTLDAFARATASIRGCLE